MQEAIRFDETNAQLVAVMTEAEAVAAEHEIITTGNRLRALLVEFYERRGWAALGYPSWRGWAAARLGRAESTAYQELVAGQIEKQISAIAEIGALPESHLRPLAPLRDDPAALRETWARANDIAEERGEQRTARHVAEAVQERAAPPAPAAAPIAEPFTPEPQVVTRFVGYGSATPEWYTPRHVVDRVIDLFGHIDLDPCSNGYGEAANVPARFHFTRDDDGLAQSWRVEPYTDDYGEESRAVRVYMNPPYGDEIGAWVDRLVSAYENGEITEAVALLPARVDTGWWEKLRAYTWCAVRGRLRFVGAESGAPFPSAIVYLGGDDTLFNDVFGELGIVYTPRNRNAI